MKIRFTINVDGYEAGSVHEFEDGVADAYVNWRRAAEYADESGGTPGLPDAPPKDKAVKRSAVKAK